MKSPLETDVRREVCGKRQYVPQIIWDPKIVMIFKHSMQMSGPPHQCATPYTAPQHPCINKTSGHNKSVQQPLTRFAGRSSVTGI